MQLWLTSAPHGLVCARVQRQFSRAAVNEAIRLGQDEIVRYLVWRGFDFVNPKVCAAWFCDSMAAWRHLTLEQAPALITAAESGHTALVEFLLAQGADVNMQSTVRAAALLRTEP